MKSILKRLLYVITVVPLFIICTILQIILIIISVCIYPLYFIIYGKIFDPDCLDGQLIVKPIIWLTNKLIDDES